MSRPRASVSIRRPCSPALTLASLPLSLALAGSAAAQIPPTRTSSESSLAPMPTPPPIQSTPPSVGALGPATQPPASPYTSHASAPGVPFIQPVYTAPEVPIPNMHPVAGPPPPNPADSPDGARQRRAWGEGGTLLPRDAGVGLYVGPTFKFTGIDRRPALMLGAEFAVVIGERFSIGAAGTALTTPLPATRNDGRTFNMRLQYAGLTLGVALVRVKFFSLGVGALIGGGRACLNDERLDRCVNKAGIFVAEPELGLSFALTKALRVVLSGGYRVAVAQAWSGPADHRLRGFTGTVSLRLGRF